MAEEPHRDGVEISALGGTLRMFGGNALFFFLMLVLAANIAVTIWQHIERHKEHETIMCTTKLAIFVYNTPRQPDGRIIIDWPSMDVTLYGCVPKFLYENRGLQRDTNR